MNCYEACIAKLIGESAEFRGEDWAEKLREFLSKKNLHARFIPIDSQVIVSQRLPNGKVHAEIQHVTLITILEKK